MTYTHGESTAEVIEDNPGAGVACVIHLEGVGGKSSRGLFNGIGYR